ncbi:hypothetical protein [Comamonas sp. JC664]|uniref:hypothetical protein n=1 Tax=Comamonas sp. JC664 TaxID=2801917 RepID=UPI0036214B33
MWAWISGPWSRACCCSPVSAFWWHCPSRLLRRARGQAPGKSGSTVVAGLLLLTCLATVGGMFLPHASVSAKSDATVVQPVAKGQAAADWAHYGSTPGGTRFAALDQITRSNVKDLQEAWRYQTGDVPVSPAAAALKTS